jgi:hypothetical protein
VIDLIESDRPAAVTKLFDDLVDRGDALANHSECERKSF